MGTLEPGAAPAFFVASEWMDMNTRDQGDITLPTQGGLREMLTISLPMVVSQASETVMVFTDRLFLSRLEPVSMNAAMGGGLTAFMLTTFFLGLIGYTTALAAQYLGAGRQKRCSTVLSQAVIIALAAYPLILAVRPLAHGLFALTDIPAEQLEPQKLYFDILLGGTILVLLRSCFASFFSGVGQTRVVMLSAITAMLVNVGASYVLIFGHFGLPAMGIRGAAYGTILGSLCGLFVLLAAYLAPANRREFGVAFPRFDGEVMRKLLRFGYPAGVELFLNLLAFTSMILIFHSHGLATATAVTIVFNWDMVSFVPLLGIQIGVVSLVGRYMGAGRPEIAERVTLSGLKMGWAYSSVILILFVGFPEQLVAVFQPDGPDPIFTEAAPLASGMLRLAGLYVLADAIMVVFSGALRGAGDTFWTMCISVGLHWLLLPVLLISLKILHLSPQTAWLALVIFFLSFSGFFYLRYRSGKWKTLAVVGKG